MSDYLEQPSLPQAEVHNTGYDNIIAKPFAMMFEKIAEPLVDHVFQPITDKNRMLGMISVNLFLTAPRLAEPWAGRSYVKHLESDEKWKAAAALGAKVFLKLLDGLDGPVARACGVTSTFGAGFDGITDMLGTHDDGQRIKQAFRANQIDDPVTELLIDARGALDAGVVVVEGGINSALTAIAKKRGHEVPESDESKANAESKIKFVASTVGDAMLLLLPFFSNPGEHTKTKRAGQTMLAASVVAGVVGLKKYAGSVKRNFARASTKPIAAE